MEADKDNEDNWKHRNTNMMCSSCMWFMPKKADPVTKVLRLGRCRRRSPTMGGWPVMFTHDWCGDHKLDENKLGALIPSI